ncbi:hypothetical protein Dda_8523 [Drechslerella dactyloides]|uniref:Uncharacterized protein n=1 Tax=Drechslerella dactyloides TaxID=74499 RepID=A0AAD6NHC7_DREDA|nr:hypothetical protein Dda_8523 [Drechslerella dactyloides]
MSTTQEPSRMSSKTSTPKRHGRRGTLLDSSDGVDNGIVRQTRRLEIDDGNQMQSSKERIYRALDGQTNVSMSRYPVSVSIRPNVGHAPWGENSTRRETNAISKDSRGDQTTAKKNKARPWICLCVLPCPPFLARWRPVVAAAALKVRLWRLATDAVESYDGRENLRYGRPEGGPVRVERMVVFRPSRGFEISV